MIAIRTLTLFGLLAFQLNAQQATEAGAEIAQTDNEAHIVPAGCWVTAEGGLERNGSSASRPLLLRPRLVWRLDFDRMIGPPLVWGDHVVVAVEVGEKRRGIEVRRIADGTLVGSREMTSTEDVDFTIWDGEIVWRFLPSTLERLRFNDRGVFYVRRKKLGDEMSAPLRDESQVYLTIDGSLQALRMVDLQPAWDSQRSVRSSLTVVDGIVYGVEQAARQVHRVVGVSAATGEVVDVSPEFELFGEVDARTKIQVAGKTMVVRFAGDTVVVGRGMPGSSFNGLRAELPLREGKIGPMEIRALNAMDSDVQIATWRLGREVALMAMKTGADQGVRLDSCELHRKLAELPPTLVRGAIYFGACAVDTPDFRMLWRIDTLDGQPLPKSRAIPAGRHLLFYDERQLVALGEAAPANPAGAELASALREGERTRVEPLVEPAIKANDFDLASDLVQRARALGSDEQWAVDLDKRIARGRKRRNAKLKEARSKELHARAEQAAAATFDEVADKVSSWKTERSSLEHREALRFLLERDPAHAGIADQIRAMLPDGVDPGAPFLAADWLDYLGAAERTDFRIFEASLADFDRDDVDPIAMQGKASLLEWRDRWRKDLKALQSERILLFTPLTQPGSTARAMATGELVCDLLESMFGHMPKRRDDPRPMLVFVYPDREEYLAESAKVGHESVEWTAGYYSWQERPSKSRLFVPKDDAGFQSALPTLAHELTHHWLMDRCQAFQPNVAQVMMAPRAFWIVEGFAGLIGQFEYDFERREARLSDRGELQRADLVASLTKRQMLPWDKLVQVSRGQFQGMLKSEQTLKVGSRTRLGRGYQATLVSLFYAQSAMLARYLYEAEDGKYRDALFDYVVAFYTGEVGKLDFEKAFGVSAKDLGPKVVAFSQKLVE